MTKTLLTREDSILDKGLVLFSCIFMELKIDELMIRISDFLKTNHVPYL